jgi:hypothetical protein
LSETTLTFKTRAFRKTNLPHDELYFSGNYNKVKALVFLPVSSDWDFMSSRSRPEFIQVRTRQQQWSSGSGPLTFSPAQLPPAAVFLPDDGDNDDGISGRTDVPLADSSHQGSVTEATHQRLGDRQQERRRRCHACLPQPTVVLMQAAANPPLFQQPHPSPRLRSEAPLAPGDLTPHTRLGLEEGFLPLTSQQSERCIDRGDHSSLSSRSGSSSSSSSDSSESSAEAPTSGGVAHHQHPQASSFSVQTQHGSASDGDPSDPEELTPHTRIGIDEGFIPLASMMSNNDRNSQFFLSNGSDTSK